jgi:signal transduction histidine kinase/ActR/RegA family two-component response regulator
MKPREKVTPLATNLLEICQFLMESAPVPMAELEGPLHIIRYANPAFCRMLGTDRKALTGKPFAETTQQGDRCLAVLDRVFRTAETVSYTESEQDESHPPYWSYSIWPILSPKQRPVGVMMQVTETTSFYQQTVAMNRELLLSSLRQHELTQVTGKINDELEQRVFERTRALVESEDALRTLATELNLAEQRERKRLATELHDYLAQMLVLGRMILGQAKRTGLPPKGEDFVKQTEEVLGNALTYCRTLMAELNPPILQEQGLPAGLIWLADHMKRHMLTVTVVIQEPVDMPLPDDRAVLIFQSVRELLINVAKHGGVKEATVRMSYKDALLQVDVIDQNGFDLNTVNPGVSPLSSKFGLFSIKERMKALGGSFEIKSAVGQGTTATLILTLTKQSVAKNSTQVLESSTRQEVQVPFFEPARSRLGSGQSTVRQKDSPIRVLLVDDHTVLREGLRSIVSAYHHLEVVGEASNGREAIKLTQQTNPDIVVMDINMPIMDGIEATRQIKIYRPEIAVIGLSVNPSAETELKMKAAGASAYLTKESAADALYQAIQNATAHKQGGLG